ncbi:MULTISPECIES: sugar ABC transporter ATP-binding protein [Heyndrickxia]|uniref:sugar ABC transporter ATP-binding protein n=1 Tax=Heyndrickxia TaxID=2837504 RepID=UPI00145971B1|nr:MULTISPECIES: sugar ABC transporter ATP-binding protein [Heyndrickxia]MEC2224068.1 sugar ABC transporter ATP-binding protein [Weizmannia sp. CD-2023]MEC2303879.1 sugar ABC transporter ATP-binding protein [Weizmannia sp. CD-2023]MEC2342174.1 sugar ABC transporter ATP-binding protein [Weizmannia sp. CD-2023]MED4840598.1 sugar ABC transporter ATP-binding protein [Weizmannia sp. CD-2023]MED4893260.1 sugar ABC transporter ATP-binding protein [Weizmannia sp. CD-2023]
MGNLLLKMEGISKTFPGVKALSNVRFDLYEGEVHALLGENGAGKSTLMKILTGIYQKDEGTIEYLGEQIEVKDIREAQKLGISMIHQELNLAPHLTVAQNIFIGREPKGSLGLFLDEKKLNNEAQKLFDRLNINLNPRELVGNLTVAKQQMVEIAKALSFDSKVLIMDEPTAALTDAEIEALFVMIRKLRADGVGVIYISHRMEELQKITDRLSIMRDGTYVGTLNTKDATIDQIIGMMVGRKIDYNRKPAIKQSSKEVVLEVKNLNRGRAIKDVSFSLHKGEILGFAGLMGAGRTEVARAIFGADRLDSGEIFIKGQKVQINSPEDAVNHGIGYLSEDRKQFGLMVDMDVKTNIVMASMKDFQRPLGWINAPKMKQQSEKMVQRLRIKTPSIKQTVKNLSGGNQQKVIIGKWLTRDTDIFIFDEPTRGIDIGAKDEIYRLLDELAQQGKSIMMISSELPEILRLSHRIIVMCEGRITGKLENDKNATQESIMALATKRISS